MLAELDSHASCSVINEAVAIEMNLSIIQASGVVHLASNAVEKRIGYVDALICHGVKQVRTRIEVMHLRGNIKMLLGINEWAPLGIAVTGLKTIYPIDEERMKNGKSSLNFTTMAKKPDTMTPRLMDDNDPLLEESATNAITKANKASNNYPYFLSKYKEYLLHIVEPLLDINARLKGFCNLSTAVIDFNTGQGIPVSKRQYNHPKVIKDEITRQLKSLLQDGIIAESTKTTSWNNPLLVVTKRDDDGSEKGYRVCIDPRPINLMIPSVSYPIPLISELHEKMDGSKVFSKLDLKSGFHQCIVNENDREKTTFSWEGIQYHYIGVPFGFKHLTSCFQRMMNDVFKLMPFVSIYVDDIIIHSKNFSEHITHLQLVLTRLNQVNLRINVEKSVIAVVELLMLGFVISDEGIKVSQSKLNQMEKWTIPTTGKQLERHLGFLNYFRNMIPKYAQITSPLELLRKQASLKNLWTEKHTNIYVKLKNILSTNIIIHYPNLNLELKVATDASQTGLGVVLYQEVEGVKQFVSFASRALSPSERNYGTTKRELLAIVFALKKFNEYLFGRTFELLTDHKALIFLNTQKHLNKMILNWLELIWEYDFKITHLPGIKNILPDSLSRFYEENEQDIENNYQTTDELNITSILLQEEADLVEILKETKELLLSRAHLHGHFGSKAMHKSLLYNESNWSGMLNDCKDIVASCLSCQRFNIYSKGFHPLKSISAKLPMDHIAIDLKEMPEAFTGEKYILVIVDVCTRFTFLHAILNKKESTIAIALFKTFCLFGFPKIIQSDNGKEFVNKIVQTLIAVAGIDHIKRIS